MDILNRCKINVSGIITLSVVWSWATSKANFRVQVQVVVISWDLLLDFLLVQNELDLGAFLDHGHIVPVASHHRDLFAHHNLSVQKLSFTEIKTKTRVHLL